MHCFNASFGGIMGVFVLSTQGAEVSINGRLIAPAADPALYWGLYYVTFAVAIFLAVCCIYIAAVRGDEKSPVIARVHANPLWRIFNYILIIWSARTGYKSMDSEILSHTNSDLLFCILAFMLTLLFVKYRLSRLDIDESDCPSLGRFSINWRHNPRQCVYLSTWYATAITAGAAIRLSHTNTKGLWVFIFYLSILLGLLLGRFTMRLTANPIRKFD